MQTLLFFRPDDGSEPDGDEIERSALAAGVALEGEAGSPYRPGRWRDPETRATCVIDVGEPPIEHDAMHPPRAYAGWRPLPLQAQIPLAGPHWRCVEGLRPVEAILAANPTWRALDTEDIAADADAEPGPAPWSRPRVIASWERLRDARIEHLGGIARMPRRASVAMWRYLRERPRGRERHPTAAWPDAVALLDKATGAACSVAAWTDPRRAIAVPPVDLLLIISGASGGLASADQLATLGGAQPAGVGLARLLEPGAAVDEWLAATELAPTTAFSALDDEDWAD